MSSLPVRGLGKAWRGQPCAYCDERDAQGCDHIFARAFFPPARRGNLPQAPACDVCANRKSKLEAELAITLPFAAKHSDAVELLNLAPAKIAGNARVQRLLEAQGARVDVTERTIDLRPVDDLEFEGDALVPLLEMIVRGLYWFEWKLRLASDFKVKARAFPRDKAEPVLDLFRQDVGATARGNIGNGAFLYEGIRTTDNPNASVWRFQILGGVTLLDTNRERRVLNELLVTTLRKDFWTRVEGAD